MKKWSAYLLALSIVTFSISTVGYVAAQSKATWTIPPQVVTSTMLKSWPTVTTWLVDNLTQEQVVSFEATFFPPLSDADTVTVLGEELKMKVLRKAPKADIDAAIKALADKQSEIQAKGAPQPQTVPLVAEKPSK